MKERLVVVGGGQAAAQLVESAREHGWAGAIILIGDEPQLPYQRPPLSKQYLAGARDVDWLLYRPREFYPGHAIEPLLGRRAVAIDRETCNVLLDDGARVAYDRLALATGCRVRRLPVPGAQARVRYLRTVADVNRIRADLDRAYRTVIIGGGFIGLEVASVLVQLGREVTVLEAESRVLGRAVAPLVSEFFAAEHGRHGVRVETGVAVVRIDGTEDGAAEVVCADGRRYDADLVIAGIGVLPNVELAAQAGLECDDGIVVDEHAATADPHIVAAGDCTRHPNAALGRRLRLETVHNAVEQAKTAAATLCGKSVPYWQVPWVWSDQYDRRLQVVGTIEGCDQHVMRGAPDEGRFSVFYFRGGRLQGVNCVNRPIDFGAARRLLNEAIFLAPAEAADPTFDLRRLLPSKAHLDFDVPWPPRAERVRRPGTYAGREAATTHR